MTPIRLTRLPMLIFSVLLAVSHLNHQVLAQENAGTAPDWASWRGSNDFGSVEGNGFPTKLNLGQNLQWKVALPGKGCSTPIVSGRSIFVTVPADGKDALICLGENGKQKWITKFSDQDAGKHRNGSGSNASPISDGDAVFVYYKRGTLAAVENDGTIRWQTNLIERFGKVELYWDHGTSPVLTKDHVVMARMHGGESWVAAFDKVSGELAWKVDRNFETPREGDHGYATPVVIEFNGKPAILVYGAEHLTIHSVEDGETLWSCGGFNPEKEELWPSIATPVVVGGVAVVAAGRNDKKQPLLYGVKLTGSGDVSDTNIIWKRNDIGTFVPTPAVWKEQVYLVRDQGEVECLNPGTGESVWRAKLPKHRKKYYTSPLIAGGILYAAREDGAAFVVDVRDGKYKLMAESELKESVIGSVVPLGKRVLLRGEKHLFCFGGESEVEQGSKAEKRSGVNWGFTPEPNLPNVLILGDSISIGYTLQVRQLLEDKANVFRPVRGAGAKTRPLNCSGTMVGLQRAKKMLEAHQWDVIHFNWGLHDLKHVKKARTNDLSNDPNSPVQSTIQEYQQNMREIVARLQQTKARLVFATTTPVVPGTLNPLRTPEAPIEYNAVATKIMEENNIPVNDLHAYCLPNLAQWQLPKNVHFNRQGSEALAERVAAIIEEELKASDP